jgi:hypothetical protein
MKTVKMNVTDSLLFFGIPGLLIYLVTCFVAPILARRGVPCIVSKVGCEDSPQLSS